MRSAWRRCELTLLAGLSQASLVRTRGSFRASRTAPRRDVPCVAGRGSCRGERRACRGRRRIPVLQTRACIRRGTPRVARRDAARPRSSRSYDHAIVARRVACRSSTSRAPLSRSRLAPSRSRSASGERSFVRAAASSSASGSLSSRAQSASNGFAFLDDRVGRPVHVRGRASTASSARRAAVGRARTSDRTRSASRLVTTRRSDGAASASSGERGRRIGEAGARRCRASTCVLLSPTRAAIDAASAEPAPSRSAIVVSTSSGSRSGASGHEHACPRPHPRPASRQSSSAKRVLPVPPGPRIVSIRGSRSYTSETASKSSRSRPRKRRGRSREVDSFPDFRSGGNSVVAELGEARPLPRSPSVGAPRGRRSSCRRGGLPSLGEQDDLAAVGEGSDASSAVHVDPHVPLARHPRRAGVQAHADRDRPRHQRSCAAATAAAAAPAAVGNATKNASPCVSTSTPPCAANAVAQHPTVLSQRHLHSASGPSMCSSRVDPSMSVKRKVTVPLGSSVRTNGPNGWPAQAQPRGPAPASRDGRPPRQRRT